ncbi:MAG: sigma 54-interacting transcriptional regulator [Blastocatellia bacterium]
MERREDREEPGVEGSLLALVEARHSILQHLQPDAAGLLDIDRFLQTAVNEIGRRLGVDRCNIITPTDEGGYRVSHEYLGDESLASGLGLNIPAKLVPLETIQRYLPQARHFSVDDSRAAQIPLWVRTTLQLIGTRAVLVSPFIFRDQLLGVLGLHYCHEPHSWSQTEIRLVEWLASQISIGLQFTQIYEEKEREVELTKLLLDLSNEISTRTDVGEIGDFVTDRALELLQADYGCLAILDGGGELLHFGELRARRGFDLRKSIEPRYRVARSLRLPEHEAIQEVITHRRPLRLDHPRQSAIARYLFSHVIQGKTALIVPVTVKEKVLGILAVVWYAHPTKLSEYHVQLLGGLANQLALALEKDRLAAEVIRLKRQLNDARAGERIIGSSPKLRRAIDMALSVADSETTVLLQGESGTGKELIASLIQFNSRRAARPFIKINCGAIPQALLETELFGHERGAFTDARARRIGRFEEASGGTLFLDEIGEMSLSAQVSLLRVLQDGELTRIGGREVVRTDVRVIAATNKNLEEEIQEGRFRRDLFYRLNVYPIALPSLRERPEDIEQLAAYFIERFQQKSGRRVAGITDRALQILKVHDWPGNVRELENCLERAVIVATGRTITEADLPEAMRAASSVPIAASQLVLTLPLTMEEVERQVILETLLHTEGDKAKAARLLGIGRKTLYRKLEEYRESPA